MINFSRLLGRTENKSKIYHDDGINWIHYLQVEQVDEDVVKILRHWRLHKRDDKNHPDSLGNFKLYMIGEEKVVEVVELKGRFFLVENPVSVFNIPE